MGIVQVNNLTKTYQRGKVKALDNISLSVEEGEIFGLVGPDGSGKTSLFRIIATLLLADSGDVTMCGLDCKKDYKAVRKMIGYMPGRFSLYQDLTVEENLNFFATMFNTTIEENYHLIKDIYQQIERFKTRRAGKLSGGMKQKLALSCALIHAPKVLLLDEPTTGVDPVSRREFWQMLARLKKEYGITIIVSTPYRDEVMQCDRIALMSEGHVETIGKPQEVMPPEIGLDHTDADFSGKPVVIEAEGLTKQFGNFVATDHISFKVYAGEIFGFLGANGAGKTTAMRMLCGLSQPSDGHATVAGYDVAKQHEKVKEHIGYMSQKFSLYDDLTIRENLKLFGGIYGMDNATIRQKSDTLLSDLDLTAHADDLVASLPLGWKQKLAFSVAVFHDPKIVFLDEPTGGVDANTRKQFWALIYAAAARGITIFVTTHYMDEAEYCDRVSIMVDGVIKALDSPTKLKEQFGVDTMYDVFVKLARTAKRE